MKKSSTIGLALIASLLMVSCSDLLIQEMARITAQAGKPSVSPGTGATITAHEALTFTFPKTVDPNAVAISGSLGTVSAGQITWSTVTNTNDTLTINSANAIAWTAGTGKSLRVTVTSNGQTTDFDYTYNVFRGVCVTTTAQGGSNGNPGSSTAPLATIQAGITKALAVYGAPAEVHVATGSYFVLSTDTDGVVMKEGISVLGGYATNWKSRDWNANPTIIIDQRNGSTTPYGGVMFKAADSITTATVLEGFTVYAAAGTGATIPTYAVGVTNGSPTIRNNTLIAAGDGTGAWRFGIYIVGSTPAASPIISSNTINSATQGGGVAADESVGIMIQGNSSAIISDNTIYAGTTSGSTGDNCAAISVSADLGAGTLVIERNTLYGGDGGASGNTASNAVVAFQGSGSRPVELRNNLIVSLHIFSAVNSRYGIYYFPSASPSLINIRNNTIVCAITNATSYGLFLAGLDSGTRTLHIDNNIFLYPTDLLATNVYSIYEGAACTPTSVNNNDFIGLSFPPTVYHDSTGNLTLSQLNANVPEINAAAGNISTDPAINSSSYRPGASTPAGVKTGGIDGAANAWGFSDDRDGKVRTGGGTTGWTMGCFEID